MSGFNNPLSKGVGGAAGVVGGFVLLESFKPAIIRKLNLVGIAFCVFTLIMFALIFLVSETHGVFYVISGCGTAAAAFFGWWAALNKKDDLNMEKSVAKFDEHLERMKAAEVKLASALESMALSGKDIDQLDAEINAEQDATEGTIMMIQAINNKAMESDKRLAHERILVQLADIDGDRVFTAKECERLRALICNMSGKDAEDEDIKKLFAQMPPLRPGSESAQMTSAEMHKLLNEHRAFDIIMPPPMLEEERILKKSIDGFQARSGAPAQQTIARADEPPGSPPSPRIASPELPTGTGQDPHAAAPASSASNPRC